MPSLDQATQPIDTSNLVPVSASPSASAPALYTGDQYPLNPNPFRRCPLPAIVVSPDDLRQFYQGGAIPQNRIMTPATISQNTGGTGTNVSNVLTFNSTSTTTTTTKVGTVQS